MAPMQSGFSTLRDVMSFLIGVGILVYAIGFTTPPPDLVSVGVGLALVGLPATALLGGGGGTRGK